MNDKQNENYFFLVIDTAPPDAIAGIQIIKVQVNVSMDKGVAAPTLFHAVTFRYLLSDNGIYQTVQGEETLQIAVPFGYDRVSWHRLLYATGKDCFTVKESEVNQRKNSGSLPLIAIIFCPVTHIRPGMDNCPRCNFALAGGV